MFVLFVMRSYLIEVRGLKPGTDSQSILVSWSYLTEVHELKRVKRTSVRSIIRSHPLGVRHGNIWD